jgi:hypothetical protein
MDIHTSIAVAIIKGKQIGQVPVIHGQAADHCPCQDLLQDRIICNFQPVFSHIRIYKYFQESGKYGPNCYSIYKPLRK